MKFFETMVIIIVIFLAYHFGKYVEQTEMEKYAVAHQHGQYIQYRGTSNVVFEWNKGFSK